MLGVMATRVFTTWWLAVLPLAIVAPEMSAARRFALVCPNYHPQTCGVGDNTMRLAEELQRRGHEAAIFTRDPAAPNPEAPTVPVVGVPGRLPVVIAQRVRRELDRFAPTDLIIQYTPQMLNAWRWGSPAVLGLALDARRKGIKVTLVAHELFFVWQRRPDLAVAAALLRAQFAALAAVAHRVFVTVEARAQLIAGWLRAARIKSDVGVVRIGSGALPVRRKPRAGELRLGTFTTLAVGKRMDVVLDCFRIIAEQRPDARLILLGDFAHSGPARLRAFEQTVAANPARDRIRIAGKQTLSAIAQEVADLDVFLFPMETGANTRSSTLPLALGSGLPVVATRARETDDLFVDNENIVLAEALEGDAFAAATLRILNDKKLSDRVSRGAETLYRDHLSWQRIGDHLLAEI
jgi:glycosyltransferase involved in cell wall biosynthesis